MWNNYTTAELLRIVDKVWRRIRLVDGYQPFGHDWPTLRMTHPQLAQLLSELYMVLRARMAIAALYGRE